MTEEAINDTCPDCETNLFVYGSSHTDIDYVCEGCGARFNVADGEIEVVDHAGEGAATPPVSGDLSSGREPQG